VIFRNKANIFAAMYVYKIMGLRLLFISLLFTFSVTVQADSTHQFVKDQFYKKLITLDSQIPVFYNNNVRLEILNMQKNTGGKTAEMIAKGKFVMSHFQPFFDSFNLPRELALLAVVNTFLNPEFTDYETGASGVWPLSFSIAKRYGLITNSYVDQRRNMELSANVFANYIFDLENIYQNWHMAITAFYAGPINLNIGIRKAGNSLEYDKIHEQLNPNQQNCIERFMALRYFINFPDEHKIQPGKYYYHPFDTVCTPVSISLDLVADKLEEKRTVISSLNPDYREGIVPDINGCRCFKIPATKKVLYLEKRNEIEKIDSVSPILIDPNRNIPIVTNESDKDETQTKPQVSGSSDPKLIYYTIKPGDNLHLLSKVFDCTINELKRWNGMSNNTLYAGKKLKVYVPGNRIPEYKKIDSMTMSQKQALMRKK
jgi:membrane-bound lytic murein transglycosylase D